MKEMLSFGGAAAIGVGIAFSGKKIMEFETAMASLQAVTGVSGSDLVEFKAQIFDVAKASKISSIDVAKSFETIGSAMSQYLTDPDSLKKIANAGVMLSKASRMELQPSLEALTSVMNQFGLGADMALDTVNRLTAGEIAGSVSTQKISEYLQEFGASAKNANIGVGESVALIEALGVQMDHSKIAVGARNILSIMDSAKAMPKEAIESLKKNGVQLSVLGDKSKTLGERLTELSKIQNDSVAMTRVFGRENKTAGTVIFSQLETYKKFEEQIASTDKAKEQAATNSNTLAVRLEELKAAWVNMITGSEQADSSLNGIKSVIAFVTDNLGGIVKAIGTAIAIIIAWKTAIFLTKGALILYNAIAKAIFLVDMIKYIASTTGLTFAQSALAIAQAELNTIMAANPMGLMVIGIAALVAFVVIAISYWDSFGAAIMMVGGIIAAFFSPVLAGFALLISVIMSVYNNWNNIVQAFSQGGISEGLLMIGKVLLDAVLNPLQQILQLIAKVTGFDWAENAAKELENFRADMGVNVTQSEHVAAVNPKQAEPVEAVNPKQAEQDAMVSRMETVSNQNVAVTIKDQTGKASVSNSGGAVPITLTSTQSWQRFLSH
jgi:TP901 family phage tail tape measure protein